MPQHQTQIIKGESQTGCRTGSSTIDHLFKVNQILQKYWENNIDINQTYVDFKHFTNVLSQYMWKNKISVLQWPLSIPLATQTHLPLQDTRILTWWWPPETETCRLIIKIPYISFNKLFSNSCLVFNLNYYKYVVLDVHTLLFSIWLSVC